jgi:carbon-monoxide dehydrogenase small subunit
MNGQPVYSCSQLAVWVDGASIQTVEGLARNDQLSPVQEAFVENNGPQCGFCTPGQLMTATALLNSNPRPNPEEVREAMVGNLCRCSNYNAIVEAVVAAAEGENQGGVA